MSARGRPVKGRYEVICTARAGPVRAKRSIRVKCERSGAAAPARRPARAPRPAELDLRSHTEMKRTKHKLKFYTEVVRADGGSLDEYEFPQVNITVNNFGSFETKYG